MTLRTVLLIALGSFLAGLAMRLRDYRIPLVAAESVAFFLAGQGLGECVDALARNRRR